MKDVPRWNAEWEGVRPTSVPGDPSYRQDDVLYYKGIRSIFFVADDLAGF